MVANTLSRADREAMLLSVRWSVRAYVRKQFPMNQADDITQDLLMNIWQLMHKFDPTKGIKFSTWAIGIAKRLCTRIKYAYANGEGRIGRRNAVHLKRFVDPRSSSFDVDASEADPAEIEDCAFDDLRRGMRAVALEPILAKRSPFCRACVELVLLDGLSPARAAEQLARSVKDVKLTLRNFGRAMGYVVNDAGEVAKYDRKRSRTAMPLAI